jgi:hypothetical protein
MRTIKGRYTVTGYNAETGLDETIKQVDHLFEAADICQRCAGKYQYTQVIVDMACVGDVSVWNYVDGEFTPAHIKRTPPPANLSLDDVLQQEEIDQPTPLLRQYLTNM